MLEPQSLHPGAPIDSAAVRELMLALATFPYLHIRLRLMVALILSSYRGPDGEWLSSMGSAALGDLLGCDASQVRVELQLLNYERAIRVHRNGGGAGNPTVYELTLSRETVIAQRTDAGLTRRLRRFNNYLGTFVPRVSPGPGRPGDG